MSGNWARGNVSIHDAYTYDADGRMASSSTSVRGQGTSRDLAGIALAGTGAAASLGEMGDLRFDNQRTNMQYNGKGQMSQSDYVTTQYGKTSENYLSSSRKATGGRKTKSREVVGLLTTTGVDKTVEFNTLGQAIKTAGTWASSTGSSGWSNQSNITYDAQGRMASATTESYTRSVGQSKGKSYVADINDKKDQTFTYDALGIMTSHDGKSYFHNENVTMSRSGNFFSKPAGQFFNAMTQVALNFIPVVGPFVSLAYTVGVAYSMGASPRQMWQTLGVTVAAMAVGGAIKGASSAAKTANATSSTVMTGAATGFKTAFTATVFEGTRAFFTKVVSAGVSSQLGTWAVKKLGVKNEFSQFLVRSAIGAFIGGFNNAKSNNPAEKSVGLGMRLSNATFGTLTSLPSLGFLSLVSAGLQSRSEHAGNNFGWAVLSKASGDIGESIEAFAVAATKTTVPTAAKDKPANAPSVANDVPSHYSNSRGQINAKQTDNTGGEIFRHENNGTENDQNSELRVPLADPVKNDDASGDGSLSGKSTEMAGAAAQMLRNSLSQEGQEIGLKQDNNGVSGNLVNSERKMTVEIGANGKLRAEIDGNLWGGKDNFEILGVTRGKDGRIEQAVGRMEMDSAVGRIAMDWTYNGKDSEGLRAVTSDLKKSAGSIEVKTADGESTSFAKRLEDATGMVEQRADGQTRRVILGQNKLTGEPMALAVEHIDKKGNATLLVYNDKTSDGVQTGSIHARSAGGKYTEVGRFVDGHADSVAVQTRLSRAIAAAKDPKAAAALKSAIAGVSHVHTETDLKGRITREIGFDSKGRLAYALNAADKQLLVFNGQDAFKFTKNKLSSDAVTKTDITNLAMSMPYTGAGDTANAVQQLVQLQEKTDQLGVEAAKADVVAMAKAQGRLERKDASGPVILSEAKDLSQRTAQKLAPSFGPMLERLGFTKDQISQATVALAAHIEKLTADPASPLGLVRTALVELRNAVKSLVSVRSTAAAVPTREDVGRSIKVEQKLQEVIFKTIKRGFLPLSLGDLLRNFIVGEIRTASLRLSQAAAGESTQLKSDFAFGFTQSSIYVQSGEKSSATELGEIFGGTIPGFAEFGGAGILRNGVKQLYDSKGKEGWLQTGLGALVLIPGARAILSAGKDASLAVRAGRILVNESPVAERLGASKSIIAMKKLVPLANELPKNGLFARVMNSDRALLFLNEGEEFAGRMDPDLAKTVTFKKGEAFVAAYEDIAELRTPNKLAQKLTLMKDRAGTVLRSNADTVIVFKNDSIALATPVNSTLRGYGNSGRGITKGLAREWIMENNTLASLQSKGLKIEVVYSVDEIGRKFEWNTVVRDGKTYWEPSKVPLTKINPNQSNRMKSIGSSISDRKIDLGSEKRAPISNISIDALHVDSFGPTSGSARVTEISKFTEKYLSKTQNTFTPTSRSNQTLLKNVAVIGVSGAIAGASVIEAGDSSPLGPTLFHIPNATASNGCARKMGVNSSVL